VLEKYYTPDEVGELLSVTPQTVKRWARAGKLNVVYLNQKNMRIKESELEAFLEQQTKKPVRKAKKQPEEV
jgi:excisionase family DNA binding protein